MAGAIKDYGAGILVGTTTYGKGTVQTVQQLTSVPDAAVKLTIAEYLSPKGNKINGIGVKPDYYAEGADKQLETAEKVLLDRMDNEGEEGAKTLLLDPGRKTAYLDGLKVAAAQGEPFLEENTLMVPLRLVGVFLDGSLSWDDSAGTATLEYGDSKAVISAGEKSVSIGAGTAVLPVSPKMVKGRMYVPLRLLSSFKGITVDWDPVLDCAEVSRNY